MTYSMHNQIRLDGFSDEQAVALAEDVLVSNRELTTNREYWPEDATNESIIKCVASDSDLCSKYEVSEIVKMISENMDQLGRFE